MIRKFKTNAGAVITIVVTLSNDIPGVAHVTTGTIHISRGHNVVAYESKTINCTKNLLKCGISYDVTLQNSGFFIVTLYNGTLIVSEFKIRDHICDPMQTELKTAPV